VANYTQEFINYLNLVHNTWSKIVAGVAQPDIVDEQTVCCLETMMPGVSTCDLAYITSQMQARTIFRNLDSPDDRDTILENLGRLKWMIPSLFTFFEGLKYLEPCTKILKDILPRNLKRSIKESLERCYYPPEKLTVEYAEGDVRSHPSISKTADFEVSYRQLWLFALRNFPRMSSTNTLKEADEDKPPTTAPCPLLKQAFGELASRVGFRTARIEEIVGQNATHQLAMQLTGHLQGDVADEAFLEKVAAILSQRQARPAYVGSASLAGSKQLQAKLRCGIPFTRDHTSDRDYLFLPKLHLPAFPQPVDNVSTFCCKREMFVGFLGEVGWTPILAASNN
jgi:hypothetical protein